MTMTDTITETLRQLHVARTALADVSASIKAHETAARESIAERYTLRETVASLVSVLEGEVKALAEAAYATTGETAPAPAPPAGGQGGPVTPYYQDDAVTIYHGDCWEMLSALSGDYAIVSDPPYGMDWDTDMTRFSGGSGGLQRASRVRDWPCIANDAQPFDPAPWLSYPSCVLWGVNHFATRVPVGTWLIWLKKPAARYGAFLSDAEVAWVKGGHGIYAREFQWEGLNRQEERGQHYHPTQKPTAIMRWCIEVGAKNDLPVLDPFMGSGTTLFAAKSLGRSAIGIEIEERYCEIAANRCRQEVFDFGGSA